MKTKAVVLRGPKDIGLVEREIRLGPEDVLVKTYLAGICGTDKNFYLGYLPRMNGPGYAPDDPLIEFPYEIGHEGGGTVEEVGSKVRRFKPGDFVMSFNVNGTMADYFVADEDDLEPAPVGLSKDLACLGEPIACAMFAGLHSNVNLGDTAVTFGVGFAGQIISQVMKQKGANKLIAVDVVDHKLELAQQLGADYIINARRENAVQRILEITKGRGADVVAEAAGAAETINASIASVKHNGTLIFYSWVTQDVNINISRLHHDSLHVINTGLVHHSVEERKVWTPWALRPVVQGMVKIDPLVNRSFKLDQAADAFKTDVEDPESVKVVMAP
jgi:2-desacetyl-2-hydroxyethyl bacteriochlorophyllide A dehydrogenase